MLHAASPQDCWLVSGEPQATSDVATVYRQYLPQDTVKRYAVGTAMSLLDSRAFCQAVGGAVYSPLTPDDANYVANVAGTWAGAGVENVNGVWYDSRGNDVTGALAAMWDTDQPGTYECARVGYPSEYVVFGSRCTTRRRFMCEIDFRL